MALEFYCDCGDSQMEHVSQPNEQGKHPCLKCDCDDFMPLGDEEEGNDLDG